MGGRPPTKYPGVAAATPDEPRANNIEIKKEKKKGQSK
jgi:hypothetical protein